MTQERNSLICSLYREGRTQADLASQFEITEAWVGQILKRAGLTKEDRPETPIVKRPSFTGVNLTEAVKDALRKEAKREGVSMSAWISDLVTKELKTRGINAEIVVFLKEEDVRLPLEG